jgi:hypothetical protein
MSATESPPNEIVRRAICGFFAKKAALFLNHRLTTVVYFTHI